MKKNTNLTRKEKTRLGVLGDEKSFQVSHFFRSNIISLSCFQHTSTSIVLRIQFSSVTRTIQLWITRQFPIAQQPLCHQTGEILNFFKMRISVFNIVNNYFFDPRVSGAPIFCLSFIGGCVPEPFMSQNSKKSMKSRDYMKVDTFPDEVRVDCLTKRYLDAYWCVSTLVKLVERLVAATQTQ